MIEPPPFIRPDTWLAFCEMRQELSERDKRIPFTQRAAKMVIEKLTEFHAQGWDCNYVLREAAINSWRSVYVPRDCPRIRPIRAETPHQEKPEVVDPVRHAEIMAKVRSLGSKFTQPTKDLLN